MDEPLKPKRKDPDIDGGYAWAILAGCFMLYLCVVGTVKAYGVLYTEMETFYEGGSGNTAWIGSLAILLMLGLGPLSNCLSQRFSFRKVAFVGGLCLGLGFVTSAFVPRMEYLYLTFGLLGGLGYGLAFAPCATIISFYFEERRALANGITVSASGIGALVFPTVYRFLITEYTLKGTLIIMGGVLLNACAAACIFRQPKVLQQVKNARERLIKAEKQRKSDNKKLLNGNVHDTHETKIDTGCCAGCNIKPSIFKNRRFLLYTVCFTLCMNGYGNNIILIPSHIKALGYSDTEVVIAVSIMGGCEVFARIFMGWLADNKLKPQRIFMVCMFVGAIFAFIAPSMDSFIFMAVYAGIIGVFPGSFWSFLPVILIDAVGMVDFTAAFGLMSMCLGLGCSISQPAIGWIRDATGNWNVSFYVTGCLFCCAGLIVLEPLIIPQKKDDDEEDPDEDSPRKVIPLRTPSKRLNTSMISDNTDSLLDEDNDVSFSSHRISKIYRPYKPKTPPESPKKITAPLVTTEDI